MAKQRSEWCYWQICISGVLSVQMLGPMQSLVITRFVSTSDKLGLMSVY